MCAPVRNDILLNAIGQKPGCWVLSFLREENLSDHAAEDTGKEEQGSQNGKQFGDQGLSGLLLVYGGKSSRGRDIVVQEVGEDENRQRQNQRPQGECLEFLFHSAIPFGL